jgi:hypothetical protein
MFDSHIKSNTVDAKQSSISLWTQRFERRAAQKCARLKLSTRTNQGKDSITAS